jgi:hypothetical protein
VKQPQQGSPQVLRRKKRENHDVYLSNELCADKKVGGGGGGRMMGLGSDPSYNHHGGADSTFDMNQIKGSLMTGFGSAWSSAKVLTGQATQQASTMWNRNDGAGAGGGVGGTGGVFSTSAYSNTASGLWSSVTSTASSLAAAITKPNDGEGGGDGLSDLQLSKESFQGL